MITEDIFLKMVSNAVKAPSGHNTQPWLFMKVADGLVVMPDFKRALPVADPEHRELYISLGCAVENAMLAAKFYGFNPVVNFNLLESENKIKITLTRNEITNEPELFSFINVRQTTRNLYDNTPISELNRYILSQSIEQNGIVTEFFIGREQINRLKPYIFEANTIQVNNADFKKELINWLRFSEKDAMHQGDGLQAACIGAPSLGKTIGNFVFKNFVTAKSEEKRLQKQLDATSALVMFSTQNNNIDDWIKTGIAFQRFGLTATKLGINLSHINMPCQVTQVKNKMVKDLALIEFPQLIIRLGCSEKMPYSLRRRVHYVVLK